MVVRGGPRRLRTTTLINRYVYNHGALFHSFEAGPRYQLRGRGPRDQHSADCGVRGLYLLLNGLAGRVARPL